MKKMFVIVLAVLMALASMNGIALANADKVEVEFCVGDETLMINGAAVVVEKPYVVGAGVTLVPLRVITEAFGAQVEWIGETKTINLTYPDVKIVLQIDNPIAEINGRAEELLAAPELTPSGYTMVPLRFISENFGATVSYDAETQRITVVKDMSAQTGSTVEGGIETTYVGDSYFKWYIENPKDMTMSSRRFDGRYTVFSYDENNSFSISIYNLTEDYDFEKEYTELKASTQGMTLVKADKDSAKKTMHLQVKDKNYFYDSYTLVSDKYIIEVEGDFENEKEEWKNDAVEIIGSFTLGYIFEDIYDLSNVKKSVRKFESEDMKLSVDIPAEYTMQSDEDAYNEFEFSCGDEEGKESGRVAINIFSKSSVKSAEDLAYHDLNRNKNKLNEDLCTFSEKLGKGSYTNIYTTAYQYEYEIDSTFKKSYTRDVFFEVGDYVYNIAVSIKMPGDKKDVDAIINSLDVEQLDSSEVGDILYNMEDMEGTFKADDLNTCTFDLPVGYEKVSGNSTKAVYTNLSKIFAVDVLSGGGENLMHDDLGDLAKYVAEEAVKTKGNTHQKTEEKTLGEQRYVMLLIRSETKTNVTYTETYYTLHGNDIYTFSVVYTELGYSKDSRQETADILASVKFE